jgi:hypothetical protein
MEFFLKNCDGHNIHTNKYPGETHKFIFFFWENAALKNKEKSLVFVKIYSREKNVSDKNTTIKNILDDDRVSEKKSFANMLIQQIR